MSKREIELPNYSKGEEIFNMVSHIAGSGLAIAALCISVVFAAIKGDAWSVIGAAIYGSMQVVLYTMSSIYHGLNKNKAKKVFRVIDHCTIYFLIAGTYTPITLSLIRRTDPLWGWIIFGIVWCACAFGVTLTAIDMKRFKVFSMICYLSMGWCIVFYFSKIIALLGKGGTWFLISGGVFYTLGAVIYIISKKKELKFAHSVFHLFVIAGGVMHFFMILFYVLPVN